MFIRSMEKGSEIFRDSGFNLGIQHIVGLRVVLLAKESVASSWRSGAAGYLKDL